MHYYLLVTTGHLITTPLCAAQVVVQAEMKLVTAGRPLVVGLRLDAGRGVWLAISSRRWK